MILLGLIALALGAIAIWLYRIDEKLGQIECLLSKQAERETKEVDNLAALQAEVERNTSVQTSALKLIQGLAQQIQDAGTDPAKLSAIVSQLQGNDDALAAAVAANTPADPTQGTPIV